MEFHVDVSNREPIYRQLGGQIREAVAQGRLRSGDRLPSVRELSKTLVINPNTVARVYTELERDGVLNTRPGMGVFVAEMSSDLTRAAKKKKLAELIDALLTEAVYLGYTREELQREIDARASKYEWAG